MSLPLLGLANTALITVIAWLTGKQIKIEETKQATHIKDIEGNIIATIPKTQSAAYTFTQVFFTRISNIVAQSQADVTKPDKIYKSLDADVKLTNIALVPDANFQLHGMIAILANKVVILPPTKVADFTDLNAWTLPLPVEGLKLRRSEQLEIWVWTDNGTASAITITAAVSREVEIGQH